MKDTKVGCVTLNSKTCLQNLVFTDNITNVQHILIQQNGQPQLVDIKQQGCINKRSFHNGSAC